MLRLWTSVSVAVFVWMMADESYNREQEIVAKITEINGPQWPALVLVRLFGCACGL